MGAPVSDAGGGREVEKPTKTTKPTKTNEKATKNRWRPTNNILDIPKVIIIKSAVRVI